MSDFNYYYTFYDKSRGDEVLMALRQSGAETKSEAIDFLIDRGYLHSDEVYDSAVANALGDFLGISSYNPEEDEEFEAPVGTKHSSLDEVHQRLRESGKKRRQQRIAQARRMKQQKFEGHHGHYHAEMTDEEVKEIITVVLEEDNPPESHSVYRKYPMEKVAMAMQLSGTRPSLKEWISTKVSKSAEMEMTPDIMDYPGLPVVPDSYGTNSALDSGNGVPQWYGSAETFEAPFAGAGSLFKFGGNDSALGGFTAKELTESSAIHGDFDHAALNYSGHQNIEARAEGRHPHSNSSGTMHKEWVSTEGIQIYFSGAQVKRLTNHFGISKEQLEKIMKHAIKDELETSQQGNYASFLKQYPHGYNDDLSNIELDAEGYGDISKFVSIDFTWDYTGEHDDAVSDADYYITDAIKDLVESEVEDGEYSGNGYYSYTVEMEDDKGEITEEDVDIDYSWG